MSTTVSELNMEKCHGRPMSIDTPFIETARTSLLLLAPAKAQLMLDYYIENKVHLSAWEPTRNASFYSLEHWQQQLADNHRLFETGAALKLVVLNKMPVKSSGFATLPISKGGFFRPVIWVTR